MPLLGLVVSLASVGCYDVGTIGGSLDCTPGQRDCVCDPAQSCQPGLECRADRCVDPQAGPGDEGNTSTDPGQTSAPWPEESTGTQDSSDPTNQEPGPRCDDGLQNGQETDVDCGGADCIPCALGLHCLIARDCRSNQCVAGVCQGEDPECVVDAQCKDDNSCTLDRCVANTCQHTQAPDGSACDDQSACTVGDVCRAGDCKGEDAILLRENFDRSNGFGGWSFEHYTAEASPRSTWEIGRAKSSSCGADGGFGDDPGLDHSERHRNRVLGSDVGGCHHHGFAPGWDCAWTPYVDLSNIEVEMEFSFWRHLHAPGWTPGAKGTGVRHKVAYRLKGNHGDTVLDAMESAAGYNDADWLRQSYAFKRPPKDGPQEVSLGVCYQRSGKVSRFAGWSIDDVLIRPKGCDEGL